jgi:molybdenum cofactor cytidylyltransferase
MIVGIILSAGESKRMGTPKQLLPWGNTIVLQRVLDHAAASRLERIQLILGYCADEIASRITLPAKTRIFVNPAFKEGMHTSVKCGIQNAPPDAEAFMVLLGDQPLIETRVIDRLIDSYREGGKGIVIPVCNGRRGHPVIFAARFREELLAIGDQGAREVLHRHAGVVFEVPIDSPHVLMDMDTPQDYQKARREAGEES